MRFVELVTPGDAGSVTIGPIPKRRPFFPADREPVSLMGTIARYARWTTAVFVLAALSVHTGASEENAGKEDAAALFDQAKEFVRSSDRQGALSALESSFRSGYPTPAEVLNRPDFQPLLKNPESRSSLRELLRDNTRQSTITMVTPDEPGEPLLVRGRVLVGKGGEPLASARIYVYQTADDGRYTLDRSRGEGSSNPRLFGYVQTDDSGEFEIRTIVPGSYPGTRIARHIHYAITAAGYNRVVKEIVFDWEPPLTASQRSWAERNGFPIVTPEELEDGTLMVSVVLHSGSPES
jgi:protocatechuate 3,4-dioxygenase beta subunit